jgi:hypothetical protein
MSYANTTKPDSANRRGPAARVIVDAGAAVHDENARPFADTVRIHRKKPVESCVAIALDDLFGLQSHGVLTVTN